MLTKKETLKLKNFEEYEKKIDELNTRNLVFDCEIAEHFSKSYQKPIINMIRKMTLYMVFQD